MSDGILKIAIGLFLIAHGLIHALYGSPAPPQKPGAPAWPFVLAHSWILTPLGLSVSTMRTIGTLLWILTAAGFTLAGLGFLGVPVLQNAWQSLAIAASITSLLLLALFWRLRLTLGIVIDTAILVWLTRGQ